MELITAIALLCQINIGHGTGAEVYGRTQTKMFNSALNTIVSKQETCQKKLASCIVTKEMSTRDFRVSTVLDCIKEM